MLIKCACHISTWAFVVRVHHRTVHRSAGQARTGNALLEAVLAALAWLMEGAARPSQLVLWCGSELPREALSGALALLEAAGWELALHMNLPDFVLEAEALARRVALGVAEPVRRRSGRRRCAVQTPRQPRRAPGERVAASASPPVRAHPPAVPGRGSGVLVICDGGHKPLGGALGMAVYGFVVQKQNDLIHKENGLVCRGPAAGSQVAELGAAVAALRWLAARPQRRIKLRSDCQSVIDLLTGRRRHRLRRGSVMLVRTAIRLIRRLRRSGCHLEIAHWPRKHTKAADKLCRQVYTWPATQRRVQVTSFLRTRAHM